MMCRVQWDEAQRKKEGDGLNLPDTLNTTQQRDTMRKLGMKGWKNIIVTVIRNRRWG